MNWTAESKDHFLLQTLPLHNVYATYVRLNTHTMNYDTSSNRTIRAPNELVVDSGDSTSQAIFNGAMCLTVAIPAVCLVFMTGLIQSVYAIGLR